MINVKKIEINMEESLKKRLEIICDFCNTTPTIINGSIRKIDKTNNEYKNIQTLSVTLNNVDKELKENREKIKVLTENNNALSLRAETITKNIKSKNKELKDLEEENYSLREKL